MKTLGKLTAVAGRGRAAVAGVVAVRSIPDIKRYLKIRAM